MIHSEIRCDNCGKVAPYDGTVRGRWRAHEVRTQAYSMGWNVGLKGGKDICPHCIHAPHKPPPWRVGGDGGKDFCSDCVNDTTPKN